MRADPMEYYGLSGAVQPGPDPSSIQARIGRVELLVTGNTGQFSVTWLPRRNANGQIAPEAALWFDDEGGPSLKTGATGTIHVSPLLSVPEPSAAACVALACVGLLRRRARSAL